MGSAKPDGYEYQAVNGYWWVKRDGQWVAKQKIVAEQKLGRPLTSDERVTFKDGDPSNFDPDNIIVKEKIKSKQKRIDYLKSKITMLQEELDDLLASR